MLMRNEKRVVVVILTLLIGSIFWGGQASAADQGQENMYRLYNPNSGEHFYTANPTERDNLVNLSKWYYEGIGWVAPANSGIPVYRLYNKNAGDHHYTTSRGEKNKLVALGWRYEGIGWYSAEGQQVPVYRAYNKNAKSGSHNYTTNHGEERNLVGLGWRYEGIGWYALGLGKKDLLSIYINAQTKINRANHGKKALPNTRNNKNGVVISHRGNHKIAPENSIPAFENVTTQGIETDVRLTSDGKWVIMHDDDVDRMTNGSGRVDQLPFSYIRSLRIDVGANVGNYPSQKLVVPTLDDYLAICKAKNIKAMIELKTYAVVQPKKYVELINSVAKYGLLSKTTFISFQIDQLRMLKSLYPNISVSVLQLNIGQNSVIEAQNLGPNSGIDLEISKVNQTTIDLLHRKKMTIGSWMTPTDRINMYRNMGVDMMTIDE
ncbi:glycerophosphodiester phosphodiesterase family protein [Lactococcus insecticola]|uniref:LPS biosynthesis protein n=1 Tax=Pseudolactococcus insecticola TaxID=2709158 RepID=A0A6A0B8L1_9LACT|nr:glycerophosphodiester phosphodiesterase family protein [Lactococcus insecticola]GFH41003.1 LPS biosynthesis protein [Lactococcus insecticola]